MDTDSLVVDALEFCPGVFKPEITAGHPARIKLAAFLADAEFATADEAKAYAMKLLRGEVPSRLCGEFECAATPSRGGWQPWYRQRRQSVSEGSLAPRHRVDEQRWPTEAEALEAACRAATEAATSGRRSA